MNLPCLGIDIAKVKFNVCLLLLTGKLKHKVFPNNAAGFAQLQEWLKKHQVPQVHACLFPQLAKTRLEQKPKPDCVRWR